ncbi:MAG: hypothetical protein ACR2FN_08925 [Chitinophagaceae bacterium]
MKMISVLIFFLCSFYQNKNGDGVLREMYNRYAGKWQHNFTFNQTTENYRNDSLIKTSTWYEYIVYPDKFRIDFGDKKDSNAVIFSKDSTYIFRKGKLAKTTVNDDDLTFLLGGMYFYSLDTIKATLNKFGYNTNKFHEDVWENKHVYIIGADSAKEKTNQICIDKENLIVLRFIKFDNGHKEEGIFGNHKRFGGGWSETTCSFFIDDKLFQKEIYHDCRADTEIDLKIFDPSKFSVAK